MSTIAEIQFAHEKGALAHTLGELPDVDAKILRETSTGLDNSDDFVRFDHVQPAEIRPVLEADPTVRNASVLSESANSQIWRVEFTDEAKLLNPLVTSEDGFVLHARGAIVADGQWGWHERWLLPDHDALHTIWQRAREEGFEFEILQFHPWDGVLAEHTTAKRLTEQQRETLGLAYENGYFEEPREADLGELADELGVTPSAASGRLKRGMKLLIEETFMLDQPEGRGEHRTGDSERA